MRARRSLSRLLVALAATAVLPVWATAASASRPAEVGVASSPGSDAAEFGQDTAEIARSCPQAPAGQAACFALRRVSPDGKPTAKPQPVSYFAPALQSAYNLTAFLGNGSNQTIAIVDAYDNPNAEVDLGVYRADVRNGPMDSCTTANGCFRKVNQDGGTDSYPQQDVGWGQEISLDLDMASAICPKCKILLVEANDSYLTSLAAAVDTAARLGATVISNSYGGSDLPDSSYGRSYNKPGIPITASTGDNGYGVSFPASSAYVTAVGGTSLRVSSTSRTETAWSGAGSGCSRYNAQPTWQKDTATGCPRRAVADVSAVADPYTGVQVYDTFASSTSGSGWMVFGGTSASAPIIAAVYALAGNGVTETVSGASYSYDNSTGNLFDVVSGHNGRCRPAVLCTSAGGWDGPTGLGTPNGIGAF